jgi:ring-1,2-phenylacetyl-CoA epoxidase subunit PaaC
MSATHAAADVLDLERLGDHAGIGPGAAEFVLAFADDEHIVGARHTEWIGLGPFLEEDLAFCSIAQDECGHALGLYRLLTDSVDRLALRRTPEGYRSSRLAEAPTPDWAHALVRHWLYDRAETIRWEAVRTSSFVPLAELAERALREERFHLAHADRFMAQVADGGGDATNRLTLAIERLLPLAIEAWTPVDGEGDALAAGVTSASSHDLAAGWQASIDDDLARYGLVVGQPTVGPSGRTERHETFSDFHESLNEVLSLDPDATW